MKNTVLKYGLISGGLACISMLATFMLFRDTEWAMSTRWGYSSMILIFSLIFFAIREYKAINELVNIPFGKALSIGLLIALMTSVFYAATWMYISESNPEIVEEIMSSYADAQLADATEKEKAEMAEWMELYKNPFIKFGISMMEILWVGVGLSFLFAFLHSVILKKR